MGGKDSDSDSHSDSANNAHDIIHFSFRFHSLSAGQVSPTVQSNFIIRNIFRHTINERALRVYFFLYLFLWPTAAVECRWNVGRFRLAQNTERTGVRFRVRVGLGLGLEGGSKFYG